MVALLVCAAMGHHHLALGFWLPVGAIGTALFVFRYRRFWRWFGESVFRGVASLDPIP